MGRIEPAQEEEKPEDKEIHVKDEIRDVKVTVGRHPGSGERHHDDEHQDRYLYPEETAVRPSYVVELLVMRDPQDRQQGKREDVTVELGDLFQENTNPSVSS